MASLLSRSRLDDAELARRVAAGDGAAFATLDERYRKPLTRYARSLLRRSEHDAEDVVQDVLIRAHAALREGDGPGELRPWLYRLTRNRAIDEVRRARWGDEALDDSAALLRDDREEPEAVLRRKETMRRLVSDLADLPVRQRTALLAREVDDLSAEQVAQQLGVSVPAAQMLASRARENLLKTRSARDAAHEDIRAELLDAHERGVRPSEHALRHMKECEACAAYQRELRKLTKQLHLLNPALGLPLLGLLGTQVAGGGKAIAVGAAAIALAATGGIAVLGTDTHSAGDPAPFLLKGVQALTGRAVTTGDPVPSRTAVVTAKVRVDAAPPQDGERRSVTLSCPPGMKVAGLQAPDQDEFPLGYGLSKGTIMGYATHGRVDFGRALLPHSYDVTVGLLCRRPDSNGSIADNPRLPRRGEKAGRVCVNSAYLYRTPGHLFTGTVFRGQPVSIQRTSASGEWTRVVPDVGDGGWVMTSALC